MRFSIGMPLPFTVLCDDELGLAILTVSGCSFHFQHSGYVVAIYLHSHQSLWPTIFCSRCRIAQYVGSIAKAL